MRNGIFLTLCLVLPLGACAPEPSAFTQEEKAAIAQEVEETLGQLTEAMNSHDQERIFGHFMQSEEFLYLGCTSFLLGFETFSSRIGPFYADNPEVTFQQEVVRIQVLSPAVAVAALRGGSTEAEALFWTEVLVRDEGGQWLIAHEHESWPGCPPPSGAHPLTSGSAMPGMGELDSISSEGRAGGP